LYWEKLADENVVFDRFLAKFMANTVDIINIIDIWLVVLTILKNISQLGVLFPIYGKIKNVPNHQPDIIWFTSTAICPKNVPKIIKRDVFTCRI